MDRFQHAVENTDLWRVLWDDKLVKPRNELIVHASAAAMWNSLCELADIDMSREPDAGQARSTSSSPPAGIAGPHRSQAPVQLQLSQGADAQLPQYLASEQVSCAYYVCVGFTDRDFRPERLALVTGTCAAYEARTGCAVIPRFIDARPKPSASRLPTAVKSPGNRGSSRALGRG